MPGERRENGKRNEAKQRGEENIEERNEGKKEKGGLGCGDERGRKGGGGGRRKQKVLVLATASAIVWLFCSAFSFVVPHDGGHGKRTGPA